MAGAWVAAMPSIWPEPFGIVAVLGGIPEIVDKYGAVAPPSPEKVAEAVAKVLEAHYDRDFISIRRGWRMWRDWF